MVARVRSKEKWRVMSNRCEISLGVVENILELSSDDWCRIFVKILKTNELDSLRDMLYGIGDYISSKLLLEIPQVL